MGRYAADEAAHRAGVTRERLDAIAAAGLITADAQGDFSEGDVRRIVAAEALIGAGVPLESLARGAATGVVSLDFLDAAEYERLTATSDETFAQVAARTGIPIELLVAVREALGSPPPEIDAYMRVNELAAVPYLQLATREGFSQEALERQIRVAGDGLRRVAETEADTWYQEFIAPRMAQGLRGGDVVPASAQALAALSDQMLLAIHHGRQGVAWLGNVVHGIETLLSGLGIHTPAQHPPAIVFLDVTGYTRMTQERGDAAAAQLAEELSRIVQRASAQHGGKAVKWLGDGVMFHFAESGPAVESALEMVEALARAGLPPAHVGVHCGDVIFRQGDYFGATVNTAARIADFARPGEVLVSSDVVDAAAATPDIRFVAIGPVELKGVQAALELHAAQRVS